jgi:hypothetical protein
MANTEIRNVLQQVREAENAVKEALDRPGLTQQERDLLTESFDALRDLDNTLVLADMSRSIGELQAKAKGLARLNGKIQKKLAGLRKVAKAVDASAKAVDALVKAFGILLKAGLV